jgi:HlyD family secretion protein
MPEKIVKQRAKKRRVFFILLVIIILMAIGGYFLYRYLHENQEQQYLTLYGNVDVRQVDIGFRVSGQVENLYFEEGDFVKAGQLMAKLNETPYISQIRQAEANRDSIKKSLANAEALAKRRQELVGMGGVSEEDLENANTNRNTLQASLAAAEANLTISHDNLGFTKAYAPTDGIILTRIREPGTVVNAADPVYTLSVSSPIWIRAFVNETNLGDVHFGMPADVYIDTPNAPVFHGRVGFISPVSEFTPKTVQTTKLRTDLVYRLRIYIDNPDPMLKQGMPVTVKLKLKRKNDA